MTDDRLHLRHVGIGYDVDGQVDRLRLKYLDRGDAEVAYLIAIEPNDRRRFPTEISVVRRRFIGPTVRDVAEDRLSDPDVAYKTEAEAWAAIDRILREAMAAVVPA